MTEPQKHPRTLPIHPLQNMGEGDYRGRGWQEVKAKCINTYTRTREETRRTSKNE